ncbi:MAG: excinuclease ABC subunit UvrC [Betaproteobacteria bacterium]|nr:excinuclease ABC subunit UvrC [Betaproteobacteria bacterium]
MELSRIPFDSATIVATLPDRPGVYRMLNARAEVLYVGKARELRKRVASYFQKSDLGPRIRMMVDQIASIEVTVTRSEGEALILENNLIKSLAPRYNILFRDDKSYPYLMATGQIYSRIGFHRGALDRTHDYFGPYPNAWAVRESIHLLQKVFRLRTCEDAVFNNRSRPCLLHQIKRCSAPCVKAITPEAYGEDVANAKLFLRGKEDDVLRVLGERMREASDRLVFEEAAILRDQIQTLSRMQQRQFVDTTTALDADAIACARANGITCVNLVMVRNGRYLGDKSFFPQHADEHANAEILGAFIGQHYAQTPVPTLILVSEEFEVDELSALLAEHAGRPVLIASRVLGERKVWLEMAGRNSTQALQQRLIEHGTQEGRMTALREALDLGDHAARVECFDVSHTQGEATVASCVVYDKFAMRNGEYRRYNINGVEPGDDYGAMRQVLTRRYEKVSRGEGVVPDLILVDGGKGQLNIARDVLAELGLTDIPLVGVSKGPERKGGMEELIVNGRIDPLILPPDSPALHLIQQIRDEAHRFAITGHRAKRAKSRTTSTLEEIPGVGSKRRRQLLERFGGLRGVASASVDELANVDGISRKLAERIYQGLH